MIFKLYSHPFHIAPDEDIQEHLRCYYELGLTDIKVTEALKQHYDTDTYGLRLVSYFFYPQFFLVLIIISVYTVRRLRKQWNILSTRQQKHTQESIYDQVIQIRKRFPTRGAESIRKTLRIDYGMRVPR
jgi:hypothetical protein